MNQPSESDRSLANAYIRLRRAIGYIGITLPFVLALGKILLKDRGLPDSISDCYYTVMRNVLVGSLCAIGVFLLFYKYEKHDFVFTDLAGVFAVCVAFFPMAPKVCHPTATEKIIGTVHYVSAALFFLTLAVISLFLFTKTYPKNTRRPRKPYDYLSLLWATRTIPEAPLRRPKRQRNCIYRICGYTIVACIVLLKLVMRPSMETQFEHIHPVFWLETIAVVAFGVSWLIKGETLWRDPKSDPAALAPIKSQANSGN
jgi:hypothetical protein